jgi:UDP-N-acetylglucosamine--N-acetylmuramyl-(pentapeptide) pyrophosphoryl-undecaprenol N-acetylglucosamine transferase
VGFPQAAGRLHNANVVPTGTPVRAVFQPRDAVECRVALGLDPARPVLLVMGGSQGAAGINELVAGSLPLLVGRLPQLQLIHLCGPADVTKARSACVSCGIRGVVHAFFGGMELALGAATVAVSRAGASSLAELAAMRVPSILIPYPSATDNHQFHNARAFEQVGAARLMEQSGATPEALVGLLAELVERPSRREAMQVALAGCHAPAAADQIAEHILRAVFQQAGGCVDRVESPGKPGRPGEPGRCGAERQRVSIA